LVELVAAVKAVALGLVAVEQQAAVAGIATAIAIALVRNFAS